MDEAQYTKTAVHTHLFNSPTIYVAREILTMDPAKPRAEALAVRDGRVVSVGTRTEVEAQAGAGAKVDTTFADKVVMSGFVEQHVHLTKGVVAVRRRLGWHVASDSSKAYAVEVTKRACLSVVVQGDDGARRARHLLLTRAHFRFLNTALNRGCSRTQS